MKLKSNVIYKSLIINDILFQNVKIFIVNDRIEIVDNWSGLTIATASTATAVFKNKEGIENE